MSLGAVKYLAYCEAMVNFFQILSNSFQILIPLARVEFLAKSGTGSFMSRSLNRSFLHLLGRGTSHCSRFTYLELTYYEIILYLKCVQVFMIDLKCIFSFLPKRGSIKPCVPCVVGGPVTMMMHMLAILGH